MDLVPHRPLAESRPACYWIPKICTAGRLINGGSPPHSNLGTYCVVESRFILKAINRVAPAASFVAILICLRYDGGCLLQDVTDESVQRRSIRIGDIHVVCCIVPEVPVVEWLEEGE